MFLGAHFSSSTEDSDFCKNISGLLSDFTDSEKVPLKCEGKLQEETTWKFFKACDEAGIPGINL